MVGVYFESSSGVALRAACRVEVDRRVAVKNSRCELGQTARLRAGRSSFPLRKNNERSKTCLCRKDSVCRNHIPTNLSLTAADRAGGQQYAAAERAEGPGCVSPRGLCLSIYLGAG